MTIVEGIALVTKLTVKVVAWAALGIASAITVLALGYAPNIHPGFVRADVEKADIGKVEDEIGKVEVQVSGLFDYNTDHQALDDSAKILQLKIQECMLPANAPKDVYAQTIIDTAQEYQRLTKRIYKIPACGDL